MRVDRRVLLYNGRDSVRLCRRFCRSNGWFATRSGADKTFDEVNSHIRAAQRRERRGDRRFCAIMNAKRSIIEPNRPVDCLVIGRSPVARLAAGEPVTATLIWRSQINVPPEPPCKRSDQGGG